jgi:hypothetical protein
MRNIFHEVFDIKTKSRNFYYGSRKVFSSTLSIDNIFFINASAFKFEI